jgi:hypothetical protein
MATDNVGVPRALARARKANAARNNAVKVRSQRQKNNSLSDRANSSARVPNIEDVRDAYFSGKVTTEEANDLVRSDSFALNTKPVFGGGDHPHNTKGGKPSNFSLDHEAEQAHRRAGLSQ